MKQKVAVIGAGSWGTALATVLVDNGHPVCIWARNESVVEEINQQHTHQRYLPNQSLPPELVASSSMQEVVQDKDTVIFVVPSHAMRSVVKQARPWLSKNANIIHATKGFEMDTWKRMSEVLIEELPGFENQIAVLSGPSHAEEVIRRCPTTVVVASENQSLAEEAQTLLMSPYFRVYTNPDLVGVEVGGALKNIIALAAGLCDGLGFGDNAKSALITRGLAEIARFGLALGAKPATFVGLAGVGDLVVTCTSPHSRNYRVGYMISRGKKLEQILQEMGMVAEGVKTTHAAYIMSQQYHTEMPITEQLYQVLFQQKQPSLAVEDLMQRGKTRELKEMAQGW